jgi:hypothetical protein
MKSELINKGMASSRFKRLTSSRMVREAKRSQSEITR